VVRPSWQNRYTKALLVSDTAVVIASVAGAQWLRLQGAYQGVSVAWIYYTVVSMGIAAIWLAFLAAYRTRSPRIVGAGVEEYRRVFSATLATVGLIAMILMILRPEIARGYLAIALPVGLFGLLVGRNLCRRALARRRAVGHCLTSVLAVGDAYSVRNLVQSLARERV